MTTGKRGAPARKRKATKRPRIVAPSVSPAVRILEDLGGIEGLLQSQALAGAWPLKLADFEAVFGLIVGRCRNEFGANRFLAYLCHALLDERTSNAFRREPMAAKRVELMLKAGIRQAPFLLETLRQLEQVTAALSEPGVIVADPTREGGTRRITAPETFGTVTVVPMAGKEELDPLRKLIKRSVEAAGRSLAGSKLGAPRSERINKREVVDRVERDAQENGKRGSKNRALAAEADRQGVSRDAVIQQIKRAKRDTN